jgi:hypothetical protein
MAKFRVISKIYYRMLNTLNDLNHSISRNKTVILQTDKKSFQ